MGSKGAGRLLGRGSGRESPDCGYWGATALIGMKPAQGFQRLGLPPEGPGVAQRHAGP